MKLKVKKLHPDAILPTRGSEHAIGLDLYACGKEWTTSPRFLFAGRADSFGTGIAVEIPKGYYGRIAPRSGLAAKHGIGVLGGVIDSDFRGEIRVILIVHHPFTDQRINKGDRIAQLILERADIFDVEEVTELSESDRGAGGFGSTGR